jgi:hypothetical protein
MKIFSYLHNFLHLQPIVYLKFPFTLKSSLFAACPQSQCWCQTNICMYIHTYIMSWDGFKHNRVATHFVHTYYFCLFPPLLWNGRALFQKIYWSQSFECAAEWLALVFAIDPSAVTVSDISCKNHLNGIDSKSSSSALCICFCISGLQW